MKDNNILHGNDYDAALASSAVYVAVRLNQDNGIPIEKGIEMFHLSECYKMMRIPEGGTVMDGEYWIYKDICEECGLPPTPPTRREFESSEYRRICLITNVYEAYMSFAPPLGVLEAEASTLHKELEHVFQEAGIYDYLNKHVRRYTKRSPYETAAKIARKFRDRIPEHLRFQIPEVLPENSFLR